VLRAGSADGCHLIELNWNRCHIRVISDTLVPSPSPPAANCYHPYHPSHPLEDSDPVARLMNPNCCRGWSRLMTKTTQSTMWPMAAPRGVDVHAIWFAFVDCALDSHSPFHALPNDGVFHLRGHAGDWFLICSVSRSGILSFPFCQRESLASVLPKSNPWMPFILA